MLLKGPPDAESFSSSSSQSLESLTTPCRSTRFWQPAIDTSASASCHAHCLAVMTHVSVQADRDRHRSSGLSALLGSGAWWPHAVGQNEGAIDGGDREESRPLQSNLRTSFPTAASKCERSPGTGSSRVRPLPRDRLQKSHAQAHCVVCERVYVEAGRSGVRIV